MLLDYMVWPFRVAMVSVTLANIEATAITMRLSEWHADVLSLRHLPETTMADGRETQEASAKKTGARMEKQADGV